MKHIKKTTEPESFTEWKAQANADWQPAYKSLQNPQKKDVFTALLDEQGHICCYCGMGIVRPGTSKSAIPPNYDVCHIEHLQPQCDYADLALEYSNMLASCQAEETRNPRPPIHCGQKKGDWYDPLLMISPLNPTCESFFTYTGDGRIQPNANLSETCRQSAQTTIEKLGLDIDYLDDKRENVIDGVLEGIDGLTDDEIAIFLEFYQKRDQENRLQPFCFVAVSILKEYLGIT